MEFLLLTILCVISLFSLYLAYLVDIHVTNKKLAHMMQCMLLLIALATGMTYLLSLPFWVAGLVTKSMT